MELIFIYNAGSSVFEVVNDFAHKIFSPKTYQCDLCSLTHGNFGEKKEWRTFIESLDIPVQFYHKDKWEALNKYNSNNYPCILLNKNGLIYELLNYKEISKHKDVHALIGAIKIGIIQKDKP